MRITGIPSTPTAARATEVEAKRTPASMQQIRAALSRAVQAVTGRSPSADALDVLQSQVSLETAHGSQMFNFNFGGIKGASPSGTTASYMTHEVLGGQDVTLSQGFRAYGSLDEGARDYVSTLQTRFPAAFAQAAHGSVDGFAHALKASHYYTASEASYDAGLRAAGGLAPAAPAPTLASTGSSDFSTSEELSRVLDAVAASAARIAAPDPEG
jgi:flagellar protein FlgJ